MPHGERGMGMKTLTVAATTENLEQVIAFVDGVLAEYGCPMNIQFQIDVAVEEIYVNIAHYAYRPDVGPATVCCQVEEDPLQVIIQLMDSGRPYDPLSREDPDVTLSAEEREIGGLGIYMVKSSMDDVSYRYEDGKNILTIRKKLG